MSSHSQALDSGPTSGWWSRRLVKAAYRLLVVHGTYRLLWGCHYRYVLQLHRNGVKDGETVLEIGPGDGGHLDQVNHKELTVHLLDANPGPLHTAADRLKRYRPTLHQTSALEKFPLPDASVDVVVLSMVLHCLPGNSIQDKENIFDHIANVLRPKGRFVGATVLTHGVSHHALGRAGLRLLNRKKVFSNHGDSLDHLRQALESRFEDVTITLVGRVALWQVKAQ